MSDQKASKEVEKQNVEEKTAPTDGHDDGEFKITVKKLEMPVRPRGVLAE
jgi:hypothetical protein